ncbi:MAG TPA: hypothetical protein VK034_17025, partial [Enhygromyxa sp.]|nr:hypothetical protein [Enhygromyxa sp.]
MKRLTLLAALLGGVALLPTRAEAAPPQGMPDPSQMSGIPRPEPSLGAGVVTVRCLIGGFANPAIGIEVELEITRGADTVVRTATTVDKGRATFEGLAEFYGAAMVAKATIAGQQLNSQPFVLDETTGIAVMLVATGDPGHGAGSQPADPHGGQGAVPM